MTSKRHVLEIGECAVSSYFRRENRRAGPEADSAPETDGQQCVRIRKERDIPTRAVEWPDLHAGPKFLEGLPIRWAFDGVASFRLVDALTVSEMALEKFQAGIVEESCQEISHGAPVFSWKGVAELWTRGLSLPLVSRCGQVALRSLLRVVPHFFNDMP